MNQKASTSYSMHAGVQWHWSRLTAAHTCMLHASIKPNPYPEWYSPCTLQPLHSPRSSRRWLVVQGTVTCMKVHTPHNRSLDGCCCPAGKTSTALAIARQLYGPELMKTRVMELNASDERGINVVRHKVGSLRHDSNRQLSLASMLHTAVGSGCPVQTDRMDSDGLDHSQQRLSCGRLSCWQTAE